jgi:hypothetical protein
MIKMWEKLIFTYLKKYRKNIIFLRHYKYFYYTMSVTQMS